MKTEELQYRIRTELINEGITRLKNIGFDSVNEDNIFTNDIYSVYFQTLLNDKKGESDFTDEQINSILTDIKPINK